MSDTTQVDVEKTYNKEQAVEKLRRLADSIENGTNFRISVDKEAIYVPDHAEFSIEFEEDGKEAELEFQFKWAIKEKEEAED